MTTIEKTTGDQKPTVPAGAPSAIVDPYSIRSKLMFEALSHMMTETEWPYRFITVDLVNQNGDSERFRVLGANHPDSIQDVHDRKLDISILNPGVILSMAQKGIGLFDKPMDVALIAVMPHFDQVGFAVTKSSRLKSLTDIRDKRFPLRVSIRGSLDACTQLLVEKVLKVHGFGFDDIVSWGGKVHFDQPMPHERPGGRPSRVDRVVSGELDAIFEEGVVVWTAPGVQAGLEFLDLDEEHLKLLEREGFKRGVMEKARYGALPKDVQTIDFSGWPIYTRRDASNLLIRKFCEAMHERKGTIPWNWGPVAQAPMPLEKMLKDTPETPVDMPFHPAAREVWVKLGYLS